MYQNGTFTLWMEENPDSLPHSGTRLSTCMDIKTDAKLGFSNLNSERKYIVRFEIQHDAIPDNLC